MTGALGRGASASRERGRARGSSGEVGPSVERRGEYVYINAAASRCSTLAGPVSDNIHLSDAGPGVVWGESAASVFLSTKTPRRSY